MEKVFLATGKSSDYNSISLTHKGNCVCLGSDPLLPGTQRLRRKSNFFFIKLSLSAVHECLSWKVFNILRKKSYVFSTKNPRWCSLATHFHFTETFGFSEPIIKSTFPSYLMRNFSTEA